MRLREGDRVAVKFSGSRPRRGRIIGFEPREVWSGSGMGRRSHREHWVIVAFPDGSAVTVPARDVTNESGTAWRNVREETELG